MAFALLGAPPTSSAATGSEPQPAGAAEELVATTLDAALETVAATDALDALDVAAAPPSVELPPAPEPVSEPEPEPDPVPAPVQAPAAATPPAAPDAPPVEERAVEAGDTAASSPLSEPHAEPHVDPLVGSPVTPDTGSAAAPAVPAIPPAAAAGAVQAQPVNLNVVIRIDSPGDNGAVTQLNAALAEVGATPATVSHDGADGAEEDEQYRPDGAQYQAPAAAPPAAPAETSAATPDTEWNWSWTWDCGGAATPALPAGAPGGFPTTWTWNWNWICDRDGATPENNPAEIPDQYQGTAVQYRPVNINISIRIGSPGNDGPITQTNVTQTNVAVAIALPALTLQPLASLPVALPLPVSSPVALPALTVELGGSGDEDAASAQPDGALSAFDLVPGLAAVDVAVGWSFASAPRPHANAASPARAVVPAAGGTVLGLAFASAGPASSHAAALPRPTALPAPTLQEDTHRGTGPRRAPSRHLPAPRRAPIIAPGTAGATPPGGSDGGSPLALLLVPFALALVDGAGRASRRAQGRSTAHPWSPPDPPG